MSNYYTKLRIVNLKRCIIKIIMNNSNLLAFKSISNFVKSLNECFGPNQKTLQLYSRLLEKTTLSHEDAMQKHIDIFKKFCTDNKDGIINKNSKLITDFKIPFNKRVYINLEPIFATADADEMKTIWQHLLNICSYIDPESNAKNILKESMKTNSNTGAAEENFINNLIENVSKNVDENPDNPMQSINNIMSSGLFTDLLGGMSNGLESGELDLGKLMGTVQGMISTISQMEGEGGMPMGGMPMGGMPMGGMPMGGMGGMQMGGMGGMGGMPGGGGGAPADLGAMMAQMTNMMGNINMEGGNAPVSSQELPIIEEVPEEAPNKVSEKEEVLDKVSKKEEVLEDKTKETKGVKKRGRRGRKIGRYGL